MPLPFSVPLRRLPLVAAIALATVPAAAFAQSMTQGGPATPRACCAPRTAERRRT